MFGVFDAVGFISHKTFSFEGKSIKDENNRGNRKLIKKKILFTYGKT